LCAESGEPLREVRRRVDRCAREIVASFNADVYFRVGYAAARGLARLLYRVRVGYVDEEALARVDPKSTIVFVMNNRSNMDYVLAALLAAERVALSCAFGVGLRMLVLRNLVLEPEAGLFRPAALAVVAYYANAIAHLTETLSAGSR
jgi:glycerol-3-phosphate O-acyltransferase